MCSFTLERHLRSKSSEHVHVYITEIPSDDILIVKVGRNGFFVVLSDRERGGEGNGL